MALEALAVAVLVIMMAAYALLLSRFFPLESRFALQPCNGNADSFVRWRTMPNVMLERANCRASIERSSERKAD